MRRAKRSCEIEAESDKQQFYSLVVHTEPWLMLKIYHKMYAAVAWSRDLGWSTQILERASRQNSQDYLDDDLLLETMWDA